MILTIYSTERCTYIVLARTKKKTKLKMVHSTTAVQKGRASLKLMAEVLLLTILMRKMFLQCDATIASEFFSKNLLPSML